LKNIDPDKLPHFQLPESFLEELFELTGEAESNRGFLLACVGQDGRPYIYQKSASPVVEMGIRKSLEEYLLDLENSDSLDFL